MTDKTLKSIVKVPNQESTQNVFVWSLFLLSSDGQSFMMVLAQNILQEQWTTPSLFITSTVLTKINPACTKMKKMVSKTKP